MKSSYEKYYRCCLVFNRVLGKQRFVRSFISSHLFQTGDHMKTVVRVRVRRQLSFPSNSFRFLGHLLFFLKRTFYKSHNSLPPSPPFPFPGQKISFSHTLYTFCYCQKTSPAQTIEDVLTTSNGTTFYILVEPGEHGLLGSPESIKSMKTCITFITDTQGTNCKVKAIAECVICFIVICVGLVTISFHFDVL